MEVIEVGTRVRVTHTVTDDGSEPDPNAKPVEPGYIHARKGEEGVVEHIQQALILNDLDDDSEAAITVRFDRTGTACTLLAMEIEVVD